MSALSKLFNVTVAVQLLLQINPAVISFLTIMHRWVTCANWSIVLNDACYIKSSQNGKRHTTNGKVFIFY